MWYTSPNCIKNGTWTWNILLHRVYFKCAIRKMCAYSFEVHKFKIIATFGSR